MIRMHFEENFASLMATYHSHVNMQADDLRKSKLLNVERLHGFLLNVLRGRFSLVDEGVDLLMDDEAERILIYAKVFLFDYIGVQQREEEVYALDFEQIKDFLHFLFLANETIELHEKLVDESVIDSRRPAIEMYKQSIKEYEEKAKAAKDQVERMAYLRVIDALKQDIKKFVTTDEQDQ